MTIKEICKLLPRENKTWIGLNGSRFRIDHTDFFQLDAFGDYEVETVYSIGENETEIQVAMQPVRKSHQ